MTDVPFVPGQRWVSNTEPDLGLGIVERFEARRVHLLFPAAEDVRTYAADNAPLSRVVYGVGDQVRTAEGDAFTVNERRERSGCIVYEGVDEAGQPVTVAEQLLNSFVRFSRPQDRLFTGQIDGNSRYLLRIDTRELSARHHASPAFGLLGPRVQLLPHQLYIADEVAHRHAPRVLLADEVGLGKTIESGLIVHQRLLAGTARRVLVLVPESLVHQWLVEMRRRFNLAFTVLDEARCEELEGEPSDAEADVSSEVQADAAMVNPFETTQLAIVPLPVAADSPRRLEQALDAGWDIVVVDEAHQLEWHQDRPSPGYAAVAALGERSRGLILLTATPEQLGAAAHFERLRLLDPSKYADPDAFEANEAGYAALAEQIEVLSVAQRSGQLDDGAKQALESYLDAHTKAELAALPATVPSAKAAESAWNQTVERARDALLDHHGLGRVLFRNTRAGIGGFPGRTFHPEPLTPPPSYPAALAAAQGVHVLPEQLLGPGWIGFDPRVAWLEQFLGQRDGSKTLVICAEADTATVLEEHLRTRAGMRTAVFHEGMGLVARDRAAAYFVEDEDESAEVLVASEIGSEGRNFQCARNLVLFDLPLEPDLLEQRIGRLDRIGQRETVRIYVPHLEEGPQAVLVRWYHEGLGAFEAPCPGANRVRARLRPALDAALANPGDREALDRLVADAKAELAEVNEVLQAGRERLLEANSFRPARAERIVQAVADATHELELSDYMERVFDQFGVEQERHSVRSMVLRPSDHMMFERFPGLPEDGTTVTFSRAQALAREDMNFITWEHPMVTGAMDLILNGGVGNTTVSTLKLPGVKAGVLLIEALYVLDCPGPRHLQLSRYLPATAHRVLVDANGSDLSGVLSAKQLGQLARRVPIGTAQQIVKQMRTEITRLIEKAEALAAPAEAQMLEQARAAAGAVLDPEVARMRALAQINPQVDPTEVAFVEAMREDTLEHLARSELALDAIRLAVTI